jgi:hypothetical protein
VRRNSVIDSGDAQDGAGGPHHFERGAVGLACFEQVGGAQGYARLAGEVALVSAVRPRPSALFLTPERRPKRGITAHIG